MNSLGQYMLNILKSEITFLLLPNWHFFHLVYILVSGTRPFQFQDVFFSDQEDSDDAMTLIDKKVWWLFAIGFLCGTLDKFFN